MPGIFISYRRSDNPDATGRIYDRLVAEFGKAQVFKDVDSIPLGRDFRSYLNEVVGDCDVVLAIVGPRWTDVHNEAGQRRLEDPDDFVRIELEAALARSIPVVPVLVGNALMPGSAQLPSTLTALAYRQSIEVRPDPDFHHDATRLVMALRKIIDPSAPDPSADSELVRASAKVEPRRSGLAWTIAVVAVAGMIAMLVPTLRHLNETPLATPPEMRTEIVTPATEDPTSFALSPDGKQIVFVASGDGASRLWLRSLATTTAQPLAGTEGGRYPFWSPDSRSIGFFAAGALKRLDIGSGALQALAQGLGGGGSWNEDNVILFAGSLTSPLMRVSATGGTRSAVTTLGPQHVGHRQPSFLPDGRRFLFYVRGAPDAAGIYLGSLDGSDPLRLTSADGAGVYLPSGWLLWVRAGRLMAQRLDLTKVALTGESVALAEGVTVDTTVSQSAVSLSATGLLAYRTGDANKRQLTWADRSGTALGTLGAADGNTLDNPRVSPDGRKVVVSRTVLGNTDLWLLDEARLSRLTFDEANDQFPIWSPDGTRIVFRSLRTGGGGLYQKLASGAGAEERLVTSEATVTPGNWSADGRFLLYSAIDPVTGTDLWMLPMTGDREPSVLLKTPFIEIWGAFSPDGRWVAYQSNESGRPEIHVRPFVPSGTADAVTGVAEEQWQVSTEGGFSPAWRPDGKELYYLNPAGEMMAVPITVSRATLEPGAPLRLFPTRIYGGGTNYQLGRQYDVAPDGRFLINTVVDTDAAPITLIQNWNPEAKK